MPKREILISFMNLINSQTFFKEFCFSKNCFIPKSGTELEFSDYTLFLNGYLIIFQLKERREKSDLIQKELNWLRNKIQSKATKQIRRSLGYLDEFSVLSVRNERNNIVNINRTSLKEIHKVVVYLYPEKKPLDFEPVKYHLSRTADFIHIFDFISYKFACEVLYTPIEIIKYLQFREKILTSVFDAKKQTEKHLLGRYLLSPIVPSLEFDSKNEDYSVYVDKLKMRIGDFNMRFVFKSLKEKGYKFIYGEGELSYYRIMTELALLDRAELTKFKERFDKTLENSTKNKRDIFRLIAVNNQCGFVFISIPRIEFKNRYKRLEAMTALAKYDMKLNKIIGVTIVQKDGFYIDWIYIESRWKRVPKVDEKLKENYPFKPLKKNISTVYEFDE